MYYEDYEDEYTGTYAHDVTSFSDEDIDTILMANRKPIGI